MYNIYVTYAIILFETFTSTHTVIVLNHNKKSIILLFKIIYNGVKHITIGDIFIILM